MKWILDSPERFLHEYAELQRLENDVDWLTTAWQLETNRLVSVDLNITIHDQTFAGRMTYPEMFPHSPPYIRPRNKSERWSEHQYGAGGSLCLEWRADNWQISVTGVEMVRSAYKLLTTEKHPEKTAAVPSAHYETPGQSMRSAWQRFVATSKLLRAWRALPPQSRVAIKTATIFNNNATVTYITKITDPEGAECNVSDLPTGITTSFPLFSLASDGWLFKSDSFNDSPSISTSDELLKVLIAAGFSTDDIFVRDEDNYKARLIALLGTESEALHVFLIKSEEKPTLTECGVILPAPKETRLPDECQQLSRVRVGIVGLGSVGSKIAVSLARSGVRHFLLIDDDYMVPENLIRHELEWTHVGVHKADAVHDALTLTVPEVQVDVRKTRLAGQESALNSATALKDLSNCDLLIDATANPEVFLLMAAIAEKYSKSLCWGEVFAGGYGGLIARARPGHDPNPIAVRDGIYAHLAKLPPAPYQNTQGYDADQETPLVAYDSDVGVIATTLTRLAIDTTLERNPSQFPYSVYLMGMRREWIFQEPFDTRPLDVQGAGWNSDLEPAAEEDRLKALQTLLNICEETSHASPESST